jgi:hypothetical protein
MKYIRKFESELNLSSFLEEMLSDIEAKFGVTIKFLGDHSVHQRQNKSRVVIIRLPNKTNGTIVFTLSGQDSDENLTKANIDDAISDLEKKTQLLKEIKKVMLKLEVEGFRTHIQPDNYEYRLTVIKNNA